MTLLRTCSLLAVLFIVAGEGVCQDTNSKPAPTLTQSSQSIDPKEDTSASFTLWQLPNQTPTQMMSYVIRSHNGEVIVIDGGNAGDAAYLADFLQGLGNKVEAWFITHPHCDHFDALCEILKHPGTLEISVIYASMPDRAWMHEVGSESEKVSFDRFNTALTQAGWTLTELTLGQEMNIGDVRIEVLGVKNPEIIRNPVNNSSLVLRVSDATKSVLFLGDLGVEGGDKLLNSPMANRLQSDYVQMAHHGQNGVNEGFYQRVDPTYCLWATPKWLWENDNGGGKNSGPWLTLVVRAWIDKLSVKEHYVMFNGLQKIE